MAKAAVPQKGQSSDRVDRLKKEWHDTPPRLSVERLRFLMDTYRENPTEPAPIIRARLLEKILTERTIFIDDNPIVGTSVEHRRGALPLPEFSCSWSTEGVHSGTHTDALPVEDEDLPLVAEAVEFWKGRCSEDRANALFDRMHPEIPKWNPDYSKCTVLTYHGMWGLVNVPIIQTVVNWKKLLKVGLNGFIQEAEEQLQRLPTGDQEAGPKRDFLEAAIISLKAAITFAHRYSVLARELAAKEKNPERKAELEKIAETCEWVPANPPRTFYEAVQAWWFVYVIAWMEANDGTGIGRMAEYFYPFYAEDKKQGRITEEEAIELLQLLTLKISECGLALFLGRRDLMYGWQNVGPQTTLGGVDANGNDATNELDFLLLEAQRRLKSVEPTLSVLYHDKMSEEFLMKCVDVIRTGIGQPAFYNNDIFVQRALFDYPGISLSEARNVAAVGCLQMAVCDSMFYAGHGFFNSAKMVELALNDGKDPRSGLQIGPCTGDARTFKSYQEVHDAVRKQFQYFVPLWLEWMRNHHYFMSRIAPMTFESPLVDGCLENGKDIYNGGAKYNQSGGDYVATVDLANSLAAIKKVVFDDGQITMPQLLDALQADFEGEEGEKIRRMCLDAPKFGNDDPYADDIVKEWYEILYEEHQKVHRPYPTPDSAKVPQAFSNSMHFGMGRLMGALPNGRKAGVALTDASVSAMPGTDTQGPTALAKSAASAVDCVKYGSNHLNMKFHPAILEGTEGASKLLALVKTYMDLGGHHIQFNCIEAKTLEDAQAHPEKHRDLVIRVAGFSAYFVHLPKGVQDEIIKRTELTFH